MIFQKLVLAAALCVIFLAQASLQARNNRNNRNNGDRNNERASGDGCYEIEGPNCDNAGGTRWSVERGRGSGCGLIRWGNANQYNVGRVGNSDAICVNAQIPSSGVYKVSIVGMRNTNGRKNIGCNHNNKEGDLNRCRQRFGTKCVCEDEENDVWIKAPGRPLNAPASQGNYYKAMVNCKWNTLCAIAKLNINERFYDSKYQLSAGVQEICIAGRSSRMAIDKICVSKSN